MLIVSTRDPPLRPLATRRLGCEMVVIAVGTYATSLVMLEAKILEVEMLVGGIGCEAKGFV